MAAVEGSDSEDSDIGEGFQPGILNGSAHIDPRNNLSGTPLCPIPISYPTELNTGDHILFQTSDSVPPYRPHYQSALVDRIEKTFLTIVSYSRGGIYEDRVEFGSLGKFFRVDYTSCQFPGKAAVDRARARMESGEDHFHVLYNNSHFLVSWCMTGLEYSLTTIINSLEYNEGCRYPLLPILSRQKLSSVTELNPGDHVKLKSAHYLVSSASNEGDGAEHFTAYTTSSKGLVVTETHRLLSSEEITKISYDQGSNSYHSGLALERASEEQVRKSKWSGSDQFVTMMKCGKRHILTDKCLFEDSVDPVGCTQITPYTSIDIGDHLLIREEFGSFHSAIVHSCIDDHNIVTIPNIHKKGLMGKVNLLRYNEVYRVNYTTSLPPQEVLRRACSVEGEGILKRERGGGESTQFITWAKIGRELSLNPDKLIQKRQVALLRPQAYEKVLSMDEIDVGDHLFIPNPAYRWHFLVSENIFQSGSMKKSTKFKVIYLLRGSIKETEEVVDPTKDSVFKILYTEELSSSLAIRRARTLVGKVNVSPTARMWFVRWAKTGSEEGLEVDFLVRKSLPVAKSRLSCFTQLDPGDYLVMDTGKMIPRHHYIVVRVLSPTECDVVGMWKGKLTESRVRLEEGVCHKLVYEEGTCLSSSECVRRARDVVGSPFALKYMRRKLVNLLKTTDATDVDVESLPEERLLLQRELVESAANLAPGDHLEVVAKALHKIVFKNMIVVDVISDTNVRVIQADKKNLVEVEFSLVNQTEQGEGGEGGGVTSGELKEVYRVKYTERISVKHGLDMLRRAMSERRTDKPADQLLMLATVGQPTSMELDPHLHKVLETRKEDIQRPMSASKLRSSSIEIGARVASKVAFRVGTRVALGTTRVGMFVGYGPGINILAETPIFTRRMYKLRRQRKFDQISEEDYKRGVIKQSFTSANTVLGATAGFIVGQLAIPVPVVGGLVGGALGTVTGNGLGHLEGWAASKLVKDPAAPTLPVLVRCEYLEIPES